MGEQGDYQGDQRQAPAAKPCPQQPRQQSKHKQGNHPLLGPSGEQLCRSWQQRVRRWQRTPQAPYSLDPPALKQWRRAVRQLKLGSSIDPASLDPIHLQETEISRGKTAQISEQATADRHGRRRSLD